jgi:undecaprenyl-diphosphatase
MLFHRFIPLLIRWVSGHPLWGVAATFAIAFCETLAFIGYTVPALFLLFGIGTLLGSGLLPFWPVCAAASAGAFLGDTSSYLLGRIFRGRGSGWIEHRGIRNNLDRGQRFFQRHGGKSILMGRMIGALRPIVPVVSGIADFPLLRFLWIDGLAALLWAPIYLLPGMIFGASVGLAAAVSLRLALILLLAITLLWLGHFLLRWGFGHLAPFEQHLRRLWFRLWERTEHWPSLDRLTESIDNPGGVPMLALSGLLLIGILWLFNGLLLGVLGDHWPGFIDAMALAAAARIPGGPWRNVAGDLVLWVAPAGWLLYGVPAVLILARRRSSPVFRYLGSAILFGLACDLLLSAAFSHWSHSLVIPNSIAGALAVYGVGAGITATDWPRARRLVLYALFTLPIATAIAGALFTGALWLGNAIGTGLLGLIWATLLVLAYRHHPHDPPPRRLLIALFVCILAAISGWALLTGWRLPQTPPLGLPRRAWLAGHWPGFGDRQSLARHWPTDFNVEYGGPLKPLRLALGAAGWTPPPRLTPENALSWLMTRPPVNRLPLFPTLHHGRFPALTLLQTVNHDHSRRTEWVLRLWRSSYILEPGGETLWLGQMSPFKTREHLALIALPRNQGSRRQGLAHLARSLAGQPAFRLWPRRIGRHPILLIESRRRKS